MTILSALKSLFAPLPEGAIRYKGFTIAATPEGDGGRYRISGSIRKRDRQQSCTLVDQVAAKEYCVQLAHHKAKLFIDQKGDKIFA
jgi:hypothetical protein